MGKKSYLRHAWTVGAMAICLVGAGKGQNAEQRKPVLVELFTSEGCSDCPPADRVLKAIDEQQPFAGVKAIVLSEHVTYWNHDGWTDPFSMEEVTERQQEYVDQFRLNSSYTPQMVVDGTSQLVGNNVMAVRAALEKAAADPKEDVTIANAQWQDGGAAFAVRAAHDRNAKLVAVLAANATQRKVSAGENNGKTLEHVAVVRALKTFGADSADGRVLRLGGGPLTHKDESQGPVRLVVFVVDRKTGHVLGAAEQTLSR